MRRLRDGGDCALPPLMEVPTPDQICNSPSSHSAKQRGNSWSSVKHWMKGQLDRAAQPLSSHVKRSDLQLLLGVLGSPLAPAPPPIKASSLPVNIKDAPMDASSAQYIVHQYVASSGAANLESGIGSFYALGKVRMVASEFEASSKVVRTRNPSKSAEAGCFVLWQMVPDMWCMEMDLAGSKIRVGSNGKLLWRQSPWLGSHKIKGPARPLRRTLQGLDPWTTAQIFLNARCVGEKTIANEACFILKLVADPVTLAARSEGPAEIIRHVMFGYFSQKTGLLVSLEDSHLLRIQSDSGDTIYWETSTETSLEDYRSIDGVQIAHSGQTVLTLFRFGEVAMSHTRTRLEETWSIEEVAFNVPGVSSDTFIPPADLKDGFFSEASELTTEERGKAAIINGAGRSKVAALEKSTIPISSMNDIIWRSSLEAQSRHHNDNDNVNHNHYHNRNRNQTRNHSDDDDDDDDCSL